MRLARHYTQNLWGRITYTQNLDNIGLTAGGFPLGTESTVSEQISWSPAVAWIGLSKIDHYLIGNARISKLSDLNKAVNDKRTELAELLMSDRAGMNRFME